MKTSKVMCLLLASFAAGLGCDVDRRKRYRRSIQATAHSLACGNSDARVLMPDRFSVAAPDGWVIRDNPIYEYHIIFRYQDKHGAARICVYEKSGVPKMPPSGVLDAEGFHCTYWHFPSDSTKDDTASHMFFGRVEIKGDTIWYAFDSSRPIDSNLAPILKHVQSVGICRTVERIKEQDKGAKNQ